MVGPGVGAVRLLRALAFVAAAVMITVTGHRWGGGSVGLPAVVTLAAVCWPAALLGSARQRHWRQLFPALAVGQLVGHGVLTFFPSSATTALACGGATAHHVHALAPGCLRPDGAALAPSGSAMVMPGMQGSGGASMVVAHVAAALLLAVLLGHGEALLWRVVEAVVARLPRLLPASSPAPSGVVGRLAIASRRLFLVVPGRGPPMFAA